MSKLEELIQKYCPNGVEKVELGKVCKSICTGLNPRNNFILNEQGACFHYATVKEIAADKLVFTSSTDKITPKAKEIINSRSKLEMGDVLFSGIGTIGKVYFVSINTDDWDCSESIFIIKPNKDVVNGKYLSYVLKSHYVVSQYMMCAAGSIMNGVRKSTLVGLSIPLPPLPVQEEIVRILDAMTDLQENLEKELEERRKQYAFYRDKLLSFNDLTTPPIWKIEWKQLGEIGKFYSGLSGKTKEDFTNGNAKFITYMNVFAHPILQIDVEDKVFIREGEKQHTIKYGDVLFTGSSETPEECGMTSVMTTKTEEDIYLNSFCFGYRFTSLDDICPSFMAHLFRSANIRKQIIKTANGVTRFNVSKILCEKISIPLPPLPVQEEIVAKLDKMEELVSNIENELTDRKKQYEYYRDKLLTFE